jgi:hypothetical protein
MPPAVKRRLVTLAAAVVLTDAGCMPGVYTSRPEIRGVVVAADTAEPISNAAVTVEEDRVGNPTVTVTSDARGTFRVPRATKFWFYSLMQSQAKWSYSVRAEAPGFTPTSVEVSEIGQMPPTKVEGVRLELAGSHPMGNGR